MDNSKSITSTAVVLADPGAIDLAMSHDDRLFVALYLEYGRVTQAAIEAYQEPDPIKAGRIGNAALKRMPDVFQLVMDREGLTDKDLVRRLLEGLDAEKTVFAKHLGEFMDQRQVVDHQTRAIYQRMALDLKGHTPKTALTIQDEAGRPLGPVILPVREGGHLSQPGDIQEAEVVPESATLKTEGGGTQASGGVLPDAGGSNASPVPPGGDAGEKLPGGGGDDGW